MLLRTKDELKMNSCGSGVAEKDPSTLTSTD